MSTKHRKINVSFKPKVIQALTRISKKNETSREDVYLSKLAKNAEKRAKGKPSVSAEKLWKALDLKMMRKK
ncbi:MAG TPA: hypothetical protein VLG49_01185 [Rhabdochlamydiaceae bacterium]|nr:hypothetical protein [Rhabdochlamydiaceae bacterium]